jgi:hypothetical protein
MFLDELRAYLSHLTGDEESAVARYARELRAVRGAGGARALTPVGQHVLDLADADAVRWLLAAEVVQSRGPTDDWHISIEAAADLLRVPEGPLDPREEDFTWPVPWAMLERLAQLGLVRLRDAYPDEDVMRYEVSPEGRRVMAEIASGQETPFMVLARVLLQEERAR